jgi:hypothetical protein
MSRSPLMLAVAFSINLLLSAPADATLVTVPAGAGSNGNAFQGELLNLLTEPNGARFQVDYAASLFSSISGPSYITSFSYRADMNVSAFSISIPNIIIQLSTTQVPDDGLSNTFANNVGPDVMTAYSGPLTLSTAGGTTLAAGPFDITFNLTTPFLYNPALGNLLVDLQYFGQATGTGGNIDAVDAFNDGVSRVHTGAGCVGDVTSLIGCPLNGTGLLTGRGTVTQFNVAAIPEPETYAMLLAGLGLMGVIGRRRKQKAA